MENPQAHPRRQLAEFWDRSRDYYELATETNPEEAPQREQLFVHLVGGERPLDLGSDSCDNAICGRHEDREVAELGAAIGMVLHSSPRDSR